MKSGSKMGRRNNATSPFHMVYPEKGGSGCYVAPLSPDKTCENCDLEPQRQL